MKCPFCGLWLEGEHSLVLHCAYYHSEAEDSPSERATSCVRQTDLLQPERTRHSSQLYQTGKARKPVIVSATTSQTSCIACAKVRRKCDEPLPCSRCVAKGTICVPRGRRNTLDASQNTRPRRTRTSSCSSVGSISSCGSTRSRQPRRRRRHRTRPAKRSQSSSTESSSDSLEHQHYKQERQQQNSTSQRTVSTWLCVPPTCRVLPTGQPVLPLRECTDCRRIKRYASLGDAINHMDKVHFCMFLKIVHMSSCSVVMYDDNNWRAIAGGLANKLDPNDASSGRPRTESNPTPEAQSHTIPVMTNATSVPEFAPTRSTCLAWYPRVRQHLLRLCRPRLRSGFARVAWQCECGRSFWGDFRSGDRNIPPNMSRLGSEKAMGHVTSHGPAMSARQSGNATSQLNSPPLPTLGSGSSTNNTLSQQPPALHTATSTTCTATGSVTSSQKPVFFELCVNRSRTVTTLGEVMLVDALGQILIGTDRELFEQIKRQYRELRQKGFFAWLYCPSDIHYVRFGTQPALGHFDIYQRPDALPPEEEVKKQNYHYYECPLDALPPMPTQTFFQYFRGGHAPNCADRSALFWNRLPKKLGTSMKTTIAADRIEFGWGVHIIERPNKSLLSILVAVIILISLATSIVYDVVAKSNESGFAIGQWMLGVLSATLAAGYFHLAEA